MNRMSWMVAAGAALSCHVALADLPDIFDRIPTDAAVVVVMPSLSEVDKAFTRVEETFGAEAEREIGEFADMFRNLEGLDRERGAAMFMRAGPDGVGVAGEEAMVLLVPVQDYHAFVAGLGGEAGDGVASLDIDGKPGFAKSIGGGYAAMGPARDTVEAYESPGDAGAAHEKHLGAVAARAANGADLFVAAQVAAFAQQIQQQTQDTAQQVQMMGMMAGQDMSTQAAMATALGKRLVEDGRVGFFALDLSDDGMQAGFGVQFNDGSDTAGFLQGGGDAGQLVARLPAKDMLMAYAADMSTPGAKKINEAMGGAFGQQGQVPGMDAAMEGTDGVAMLLGKSPGGLMGGGLFTASSMYFDVTDPQAHLEKIKGAFEAMNEQTIEGTKYLTSFESGVANAGETSLDGWSVRMQFDPQAGGQQQMAMGMMFGPTGGPAGYLATTDDGIVMTLAKSTELAGEAVNAATTGKGLASHTLVRSVSRHLPESRTLEAYIGFSNLVEMGMGFMAMSPMGPLNVEIPADLPPVGIGVATESGAFEARMFAPSGVITLFSDLVKAIEEAQGGPGAGPPEREARPRF